MTPREQYVELLGRYRQVESGPPWHLINTRSDEQLRAELRCSEQLGDHFGPDTHEGVIAGGVIHGWIAQALRNRQFHRERPELFA